MTDFFSATFDPRSMEALAAFADTEVWFAGSVQAGLDDAASIILARMQENMSERFMHPTGRLENSFTVVRSSTFTRDIVSDEPYAARREWSFHGPDSLGRMFPNDPAAHYARDALVDTREAVASRMTFFLSGAMARFGG